MSHCPVNDGLAKKIIAIETLVTPTCQNCTLILNDSLEFSQSRDRY